MCRSSIRYAFTIMTQQYQGVTACTVLQQANTILAVQTVRDKCFKICITSPGSSLSSSEQKCLSRCMDRYQEVSWGGSSSSSSGFFRKYASSYCCSTMECTSQSKRMQPRLTWLQGQQQQHHHHHHQQQQHQHPARWSMQSRSKK